MNKKNTGEETKEMSSALPKSMILYNKWKTNDDLPIECLLNIVLLYMKKRKIIQIDMTYYTVLVTIEAIHAILNDCVDHIVKYDSRRNIIMYLKCNQKQIERQLIRIGDGILTNAFRTSAFGTLLDPNFYACKCPHDFTTLFQQPNLVQVLLTVVQSTDKTGAFLIQMCTTKQCKKHIRQIYNTFASYARYIRKIDDTIHTALIFYTKPNIWTESPEYVFSNLRELHM